jgi:hypothetical protein
MRSNSFLRNIPYICLIQYFENNLIFHTACLHSKSAHKLIHITSSYTTVILYVSIPVRIRTLLPAHSLHLSSPQDLHTATHIHVSTYHFHFTPLSTTIHKTHILKKIIIPDSPLRLTSISTLTSPFCPLHLYNSMVFITSKE